MVSEAATFRTAPTVHTGSATPAADADGGGGAGAAPSAAASDGASAMPASAVVPVTPAALAAAATYADFTAEQRRGLDALTLALHNLQLREHAVGGRGGRGARSAADGERAVDDGAASEAPSAATTGALSGRGGKRRRRRSNKAVCGQAPQSSDGTPAALEGVEMMTEKNYAEAGYVHCMGAYWAPPHRLGWCRR